MSEHARRCNELKPALRAGVSRDKRGRLRTLRRPYFLRSTARGSRFRKPSALSGDLFPASMSQRAREIPRRAASAWPAKEDRDAETSLVREEGTTTQQAPCAAGAGMHAVMMVWPLTHNTTPVRLHDDVVRPLEPQNLERVADAADVSRVVPKVLRCRLAVEGDVARACAGAEALTW